MRTQLWRIVSIDAKSGEVEKGLWCRSHGYPHNSNVSPSGTWLSFATMHGYLVGGAPEMDPWYLYDGPSGYEPVTFVADHTIHLRFGKFVDSSDGGGPPFRSGCILPAIGAAAKALLTSPARLRKRPFKLESEDAWQSGKGHRTKFRTDPDLGVVDDKVWSAVVLATDELVITRQGIVHCFEIGADLKAHERWNVNLTALHDEFQNRARTSRLWPG